MRKHTFFPLLFLASVACDASSSSAAPPPAVAAVPATAAAAPATAATHHLASSATPLEREHDLDARLYSALAPATGNLFFSPSSIRVALAMTSAGARGDTATQMAATLALGDDPARAHDDLAAALHDWNAPSSDFKLRVVNRLWGQSGKAFRQDFLALLNDRYAAPLTELDFQHGSEPSRIAINRWVDDETEHKIPDLIPSGAIDDSTRLVLTNATYFKAGWVTPFPANATADEPFNVTSDKVTTTKMMHATVEASYAETSDAQVLSLPYRGDASMVIVLPKDRDGLDAIEKTVATQGLDAWTVPLSAALVDTTLPRFKTSAKFSLEETLSQMGMPLAFGDSADFSGMDGAHDLSISKVVHKAVIEVDEKGTEAAAATGVVMRESAVRLLEKHTVRADHPFLYFLRDGQGRVLFMGRLTNPQA